MDAVAVFIAQDLYLFALLLGAIFFFMQPRIIQKRMIVCAVVIAPLAFVLSRIAGHFYYDPRPFVAGHFVSLIVHAADNGFPSDHVLLTGAVAMIVWFFSNKLGVALWAGALLIGWARVYAGLHHPIDIAGSIAIVLISGTAHYLLAEKRRSLRTYRVIG